MGDDARAAATARAIREEVTRPNGDLAGYALPLACRWACGDVPSPLSAGWSPANQMQLMAQGHHLLPWFAHPTGQEPFREPGFAFTDYAAPMKRARDLGLPITLVGSQWASGLSQKPFIDPPAEENPNVVTENGQDARNAGKLRRYARAPKGLR